MNKATYVYTLQDNILYLKMTGKCNYANCGGFEQLLHSFADQNHQFHQIILDLTELEWVDSTVLGLMAGLTRLLKHASTAPVIVTSNSDIIHLLTSLSFNRFFNIITTSPPFVQKYKELESTQLPEKEQAETILEAHKNLIRLNPENIEQFRDVIELFEESLHSSSGKETMNNA